MEKHWLSGRMILEYLYGLAPHGGLVEVSVNEVTRGARLSRRTVQRQFRRLVAAERIRLVKSGGRDHAPTQYLLPERTEEPRALPERAVVEAMDTERRAQRAQLEKAVGAARAALGRASRTLRDAAERLDGIANRLNGGGVAV